MPEFPLIIKPNIGFRGLLVKKINSERELLDIGIQEYLDQQNAISIFEWPKKGGAALPPPCIEITLNNDENHQDSRLIELRFKENLNELKKSVDLF